MEFKPKRFCLIERVKKVYRGFNFRIIKKEQRGEETILSLKKISFKYKTLFKILYWVIRRLVSIVTRRGIRYTYFCSISFFKKSFSKYIGHVF